MNEKNCPPFSIVYYSKVPSLTSKIILFNHLAYEYVWLIVVVAIVKVKKKSSIDDDEEEEGEKKIVVILFE